MTDHGPELDANTSTILGAALEQCDLATLIVDASGIIVYLNPALEAVLAYPSGALMGKALSVVYGEQIDLAQYDELWRMLVRDGTWRGQIACQTKNGSPKTLEAVINQVRGEDGAVGHYVAFLRDVSEDSDHAAQIRQSQKFEAIGQLASGIAHEINTPTQYIGDNLQFFEDSFGGILRLLAKYDALCACVRAGEPAGPLLEEIDQLCDEIDLEFLIEEAPSAVARSLEGNRRVADVVRAMKEFAHPSAEEPIPTDINHNIENTISVCRNEWKYVATIDTQFAPDMPMVPCVPGAFNQVVLNIIVNASHAIAEKTDGGALGKGLITICTDHDKDWAIVRIGDTGAGIPKHIGERIYNPFFTTKEVGKGTGQGLAIVRSVVEELHQGSISFKTKVGEGTTFEIRIPLERAIGS